MVVIINTHLEPKYFYSCLSHYLVNIKLPLKSPPQVERPMRMFGLTALTTSSNPIPLERSHKYLSTAMFIFLIIFIIKYDPSLVLNYIAPTFH